MNKFIVVHGRPDEGHEYIGPFDEYSDAVMWGTLEFPPEETDWWPIMLHMPDEEKAVIICNACGVNKTCDDCIGEKANIVKLLTKKKEVPPKALELNLSGL